MSATEYFVNIGTERRGPMTFEELRRLWQAGAVGSQNLYWHDGMAEWAPLANLAEELGSGAAESPPPPLPVPTRSPAVNHPAASAAPTSNLAIASFILGLTALAFCITGIPAIICGHMARGEIRRSGGVVGGEGFATAGLVLGYLSTVLLGLLILGLFAGMAVPIFAKTQEQAKVAKCMNNAKQIGVACKLYAQDHDGKYPATVDELVPDYLSDRSVLVCPFAPRHAKGNDAAYILLGGQATDPPNAVLLRAPYGRRSGQRAVVRADMSARMERPGDEPALPAQPIEAEN